MKLYNSGKLKGMYTGPLKGGIGGPIAGTVKFPKKRKLTKRK